MVIANQIRKVDRVLKDIDFDMAIGLRKIYVGLKGDKEDYLTGDQTLVEVNIDTQAINI